MARVLLFIDKNDNINYELITEHNRDHRLGIEYVFNNDIKRNDYNFIELLKDNREISVNIAFDIFDKLKCHYLKIINDSKEFLNVNNNLQNVKDREYYNICFKIFCDMLLFKDKIEIDLNDYFEFCDLKLVLHGIKNGSWKHYGVNKIAYFAMKCDVINTNINKKTDEFILHVDNAYYCVYPLKNHKWYEKVWAKIKWSFVHHHNFNVKRKFMTNRKGIWEE